MRTRATNFLQIIVLMSGLAYMAMGIFFFVSPIGALKLFTPKKQEISQNMTPEQLKGIQNTQNVNFTEMWLTQIKSDDILAPLYHIFRALAGLLFVAGLAMILPLFDPLKYRGLVYINGVIFPFFTVFLFSKNFFSYLFSKKQPGAGESDHLVMVILWGICIIIGIVTLISLIMTKKQAQKGIE